MVLAIADDPAIRPGYGNEDRTAARRTGFLGANPARTLEIDDITRAVNVTKSDGDLSVTVLSCSKTNLNYQLSLEFHGAGMGDASVQDFLNSAQLVDDDGQAVGRQAFIPTRNVMPNAGSLVINMIFAPMMTTPSKLRWERTLEEKRLSVPFELDNLPLLPGAQ